jgi:6-pyruvoyltetrahydropterin/6-carboxytetrahydropterin synthase
MSGKYIITVESSFSASHLLPGCPPCDRLHGHTWRVTARWSFTRLDDKGMGADFSKLKALLNSEIRSVYDHSHLNDTAPFDTIRATAENLAREFYRLLQARSDLAPGGTLERVEVWEGSENRVAYEE